MPLPPSRSTRSQSIRRCVQLGFASFLPLVLMACFGVSFEGGEGCETDDGEEIAHLGTTNDGCNVCLCEDGELSCTLIGCIDDDPPSRGPDDCSVGDGEWIADGQSFGTECRSCTCDEGELTCHGDCGEETRNCELAPGEVIEDGDDFDVSCNSCTCSDGAISCTDFECDTDACELDQGESIGDGDSFDVGCNTCVCTRGTLLCTDRDCSAGQCELDGVTLDNGESFARDCNQCTCEDGDVSCTSEACSPDECEVDGESYGDGDSVPGERDCESCTCDAGEILCVSIGCTDTCRFGGQTYQDGESFVDDCNQCACDRGSVSCTERVCLPEGCEVEGSAYDDGATIDTGRACESCTCEDGDVLCVSIGCNTCEFDGKEYEQGASVPTEDACISCTCDSGDIECAFVGCPDPECEDGAARAPDGTEVVVDGLDCTCEAGRLDCTAPLGSCVSRGVVYQEGASVPDPNSCNTCTCIDGEVTQCTEINCPTSQIAPCDPNRDSEDFRHEAVAISSGILTVDVAYSGGCQVHSFDLCYDPIDTGGTTPEAVLHLTHIDPGDECDQAVLESRVYDLFPFTDAGFDEVFVELGRHRLLYIAP